MKLAVLALAAAVVWFGGAARGESRSATAGANRAQRGVVPTVISGKARFQVLTPALVRLEYSHSGEFTDAASVAVIGREDWPQTPFDRREQAGWMTISTELLSVRYKIGSGPFAATNLKVVWRDDRGEHEWKPGDLDDQNLGGVPASLDNRSTKAVTEPGPLSRKGCYLLDDSKTALLRAGHWLGSILGLRRMARTGISSPMGATTSPPWASCRGWSGRCRCCPVTSLAPGLAPVPGIPASSGR